MRIDNPKCVEIGAGRPCSNRNDHFSIASENIGKLPEGSGSPDWNGGAGGSGSRAGTPGSDLDYKIPF